MADKLKVWNQALVHLQRHSLTSLTQDDEPRYVFDQAWDGVVEEAFVEGDWNFAKETAQLAQSSTGTVAAGWNYVFDYPADWSRSVRLGDALPLRYCRFDEYKEQGGYIHANTDTVYLEYISTAKQADESVDDWPVHFWRYVAMKLAFETCGKLTGGVTDTERLETRLVKALRKAKNIDARNEPNKTFQTGSWLRSRKGGARSGGSMGGVVVGGEITLGDGDV